MQDGHNRANLLTYCAFSGSTVFKHRLRRVDNLRTRHGTSIVIGHSTAKRGSRGKEACQFEAFVLALRERCAENAGCAMEESCMVNTSYEYQVTTTPRHRDFFMSWSPRS
jgi:hypothetical protein